MNRIITRETAVIWLRNQSCEKQKNPINLFINDIENLRGKLNIERKHIFKFEVCIEKVCFYTRMVEDEAGLQPVVENCLMQRETNYVQYFWYDNVWRTVTVTVIVSIWMNGPVGLLMWPWMVGTVLVSNVALDGWNRPCIEATSVGLGIVFLGS
jgi:hypothetical protein